ncbi:MAG: hypothetical protein ACOCWW_01825 [Bacteroidota bacterium]
MKFSRFGGLNCYKQKNSKSPERRGFFAFIFGYEDLFLLTGRNKGKYKKWNGSKFSYEKLEKKRVFHYHGRIYFRCTDINPEFFPGCRIVKSKKGILWIYTNTETLKKGFFKFLKYIKNQGIDLDCPEVFIPEKVS